MIKWWVWNRIEDKNWNIHYILVYVPILVFNLWYSLLSAGAFCCVFAVEEAQGWSILLLDDHSGSRGDTFRCYLPEEGGTFLAIIHEVSNMSFHENLLIFWKNEWIFISPALDNWNNYHLGNLNAVCGNTGKILYFFNKFR